MKIPFKWEYIDNNFVRTKVFGGWIVSDFAEYYDGAAHRSFRVFAPDPNHGREVEEGEG